MGVGEQQGNLRKRLVYSINEIFYSLQGEGRWSGTPMVFVRFSACNLRCPFCDTDFSMGRRMSLDEIITEAERIGTGCDRVVFTGGEPSLQLDRKLVEAFHGKGYRIHIETNGTGKLPEGIDWTTLSPKSDWQKGAETKIDKADELKLVYTGQDVSRWEKFDAKFFYLQPCSGKNTKETVDFILSHPFWKLSLQTHKILDIR